MQSTSKVRGLIAAAMLAVAAPLMAQSAPPTQGTPPAPTQGTGRGDPAEMQRRQNEVLFKDITLSADQQRRVDSIQTASRDAQRTLMQSGMGMQDTTTRRQMMELRQKMLNDVRAVLTQDQQTIFDRNRAAMPARPR
jgi:Spy/CpxP family protein refolding chaperone